MNANLKWRLIGGLFVAGGVALAWFLALRPLQMAEAGAREISFQPKLFVAAPLAIVLGLFLIAGGEAVGELVKGPPRTPRQHLLVWPMFALALAAGGLAYWWYDARLHALGFVSG